MPASVYENAAAPLVILAPSDSEFRLVQQFVYTRTGIYLGEEKRELVAARLARRLRKLGVSSFGAYYRRVKRDPSERAQMLDCLTTNETRFFREPHQFEFLRSTVFPAWEARQRSARLPTRARVWCAGCSSGEEPYSVAMLLLDRLPSWSIEVLATDLSTRVLARAREGVWPIHQSEEIPMHYLKRFMLKGKGRQAGKMKVSPDVRAVVEFRHHNLHSDALPQGEPFQLVLCRNVLIYFSPDSRRRVVDRLLSRMAPGGLLFLGHAESLGTREDVRPVVPSVYALPQQPSSGGAWSTEASLPVSLVPERRKG